MSDNKIDRGNLRRLAQRVESYSALVSKRKPIFKNGNMIIKRTRADPLMQKCDLTKNSNKENEVQSSSYQSELEVTSVMTRSAAKKYISVGAIHNRVNFDQELKVQKEWPVNTSYPIPDHSADMELLKQTVTRSLKEVMSFCKNAIVPENKPIIRKEADSWELGGESVNYIDLSTYFTQEPVIINGNNETQITLHLNDNFLPHQIINIISLNDDEQNGTLVIQDDNEDCEAITLQSGNTYLLDNKYFSPKSEYFHLKDVNSVAKKSVFPNKLPNDPMMAVNNDHTYALKYSETVSVTTQPLNHAKPTKVDEESEFKLENALNDLLLNTAILKCLICGDTPQEMISLLENAKLTESVI